MKTYSASDISDMTEVVHRIQDIYPNAPIVGLGVSLGGYVAMYTCIYMYICSLCLSR